MKTIQNYLHIFWIRAITPMILLTSCKCASLFLGMLLLMQSCVMQSFIQVVPRTDVPNGSKEILVWGGSLDACADVLKKNGILYNRTESGLQTEDFMIDEGTRARFTLQQFDGSVRVIPYWGITDKVRNQMMMVTGYSHSQYASNEMQRVIYKPMEKRPKMVFDYAAQVFVEAGTLLYK